MDSILYCKLFRFNIVGRHGRILKKEYASNKYGNDRIECLSAQDCADKEGQRCCYTFLSPRSECHKTCPTGWRDIAGDGNRLSAKKNLYPVIVKVRFFRK